ncbi:MAG: hypothetical protein JWN52_7684 [Actinomycetia bacterium]|nr:hypothetical protein [Actinomycetes bacterium]
MTSKDLPSTGDKNSISLFGLVNRVQKLFLAQHLVVPLRRRIPSRLSFSVFIEEIACPLVACCEASATVMNEDGRVACFYIVGVEFADGEVVGTLLQLAVVQGGFDRHRLAVGCAEKGALRQVSCCNPCVLIDGAGAE